MTGARLGSIVIGGKAVSIDVPRLMESRLLVQANSGAGKSWALRRLLEQTHGMVPHVVLDIEDEFQTLREKFPYVLAGAAGADCSAEVKVAPLLARRILEHGFSSIISLYELKAHERMRFVRSFLEELIAAPRALWRPLLVVVDEAHLFCPEKGQAESAGAVIDLMTRGRKRGYCGVLATQRISKLNKDAAAEANNKLIGRSALDLDMRRSADELGFSGKEEQHRLRNLEPGRFYAFGPALSSTIALLDVGPVQTTHPEPGSRGSLKPPPAPEKLKAILAKLADLPKDAEAETTELQRLRQENAELRRKNAAGKPQEPDQQALEIARRAGRAEAHVTVVTNLKRYPPRIQAALDTLTEVGGVVRQIGLDLEDLKRLYSEPVAAAAESGGKPRNPAESRGIVAVGAGKATSLPFPAAGNARETGDVAGPEQRVLDALAWWSSIGVQSPDKGQIGFLAGYRVGKKVGGTFGNVLGALRGRGLVDYPAPGVASLTDDGVRVARSPREKPTTEALQRAINDRLDNTESRVLQTIIDAYPEALTKQEAGQRSGYSVADRVGGTFGNILGRLRSLGLIDYPAPGRVVALPVLFLEER